MPGPIHVAIVGVVCISVLSSTSKTEGFASAFVAAGIAGAILFAAAYVLNLPWFGRARARVSELLESTGGSDFIVVRTLSRFEKSPPRDASIVDDYVHPWLSYFAVELRRDGFTVWSTGGHRFARFDYAGVQRIEVGRSWFGNYVERCIEISGVSDGNPYKISLVPVRMASITLKPVDDEEFGRALHDFVAGCRESARKVSDSP